MKNDILGLSNGALPSEPNRHDFIATFGFEAPESIRSSALTPVHTVSGSLSPAGRLLVSFAAFSLFSF